MAIGQGQNHLFLSYILSIPRVVTLQGLARHQVNEVCEPASTPTAIHARNPLSFIESRKLAPRPVSGEFLVKRPLGYERAPDTAGARHIDRV